MGQGARGNIGAMANEMGANLRAIALGSGRTVRTAVGGEGHTCALLDDASIKCWGRGNFGQLGQGATEHRGDAASEMGANLSAIALGTDRSGVAVAAGGSHSCALLDNYSLKCWGLGSHGQLGQGHSLNIGDASGEMADSLGAIALGAGRTVRVVAAGALHTCALLDDRSVKCWGRGVQGQLGLGGSDDWGDNASEMGDNLRAVALGVGRRARAIAAGNAHSCALLDDASVKCWGEGARGQLGQGNGNNIGDEGGEMGDSLGAIALGTGLTARAIALGGFIVVLC